MKRILLMMLAVAGMAATSCERSFDDGGVAVGNEAKVSVNIEFPAMQTRAAYSDGTTATELQYAVFEKKNDVLKRIETYTVDSDNPEEIHISKQIEFQLVTGRTYQFVFWAAAPSEGDDWTNPYTVEFTEEGATMEVDYSKILANDERNDAFFASVEKEITGDVQMSVELTRPFAQINVGTSDYEVAEDQECAPDLSQIVLNKAYTTLDLVTGAATGNNGDTTFAFNDIDSSKKFPIDNYEYLAMTYVLASAEEEADYTVTFSYKEGADGDVTNRTVGSVPVRRNFRTNMFGQVLTSTASVNVIIVPEYEEPDYNYSQLLFAAAVGGTAVLEGDVDLNEHGNVLTFTRDAVVDLNGKTIKSLKGKDGAITVLGADLTIKGDGTMESTDDDHCTLIWADNGGTVTIENGTFTANGNDDQLIYIGQNGGTIYIKGGTFKINDDPKFTLNCQDNAVKNGTAKFVVTGGAFHNYDPAEAYTEPAPYRPINWVAPGYKSVKTTIDGDENWYIVIPADTDIISVPTDMTQDDFNEAITNAADNAIFYLGDDVDLKLPSNATVNKNFTFVGNGADKSTIKDLNHETATGSNLTFENLTLQVAQGGSFTSLGFQGAESITLKNVTVKGEFHTFSATTAVFEGCTFNHDRINNTARQGLWCEAYGTTVIKDCIFQVVPTNPSHETKAILIYSDYNFEMGDVEVTNCQFLAGNKSEKAAVEIHSEKFTSAGTLTITDCTWDDKTYEGGLWREINNTASGKPQTKFYTVIENGEEVQTSAQ
ncbi:MAG: hypothetical protein J1D86_06220 [Alistipes sp.]|nr:hypothetical protein [Alistipes sp.]